jgi:hypothetical protein
MPSIKAILLTVILGLGLVTARAAGPPRPSHLHIDSATLTTGSGAPLSLTNADIELPPRELKNRMPTVISKGEAFITSDALTILIADKVSTKSIDKFRVETEDGQRAKISGTMKKAGLPVSVTIEGPLTLTRDGILHLKIESEKALGIPMKSLADALGLSPEKTVKTKQTRAVRIEKDALLVDPSALLGTAEGRVVEATTSSKGLTLRFGPENKKQASTPSRPGQRSPASAPRASDRR